jgi:hypothetical protein
MQPATHFHRCLIGRTFDEVVIAMTTSKETQQVKTQDGMPIVKGVALLKRKRRVAGPKVAPLIAMPTFPLLSEDDWQLFLQLLPSRPELILLRSKLDALLVTYLGILEAEATSPSAREVATVLEDLAWRAQRFTKELRKLDIRWGDEGSEAFNTVTETAADILTNISIKPENRSVLDAALRANALLAVIAGREARRLAEGSKKGRRIHGQPTAWMLRQLARLLRDNGLSISLPPKWDDPFCVLSQHFLRVALTRAKALREPGWAGEEIKTALNLSKQVFLGRLRRAAQPPAESSLPI